jgi:endonuclease-3
VNKEHLLVTLGRKRFEKTEDSSVQFVDNSDANKFLNDIINYPHVFVLACMMNRQIKAERVWMIPSLVKEEIGSFDIQSLSEKTLEYYLELFDRCKFHRFNDTMAKVFYSGVHHITNVYNGDASNIWKGNPSSAAVVYRFLQFEGCGIKIATMAANLLARQFKVPLSDYYSIDISPDLHIMRVLHRTGLVSKDADINSVIYKARELCPEFPGIIDLSCWEIGREWCRPINPKCGNCSISSECYKNI